MIKLVFLPLMKSVSKRSESLKRGATVSGFEVQRFVNRAFVVILIHVHFTFISISDRVH